MKTSVPQLYKHGYRIFPSGQKVLWIVRLCFTQYFKKLDSNREPSGLYSKMSCRGVQPRITPFLPPPTPVESLILALSTSLTAFRVDGEGGFMIKLKREICWLRSLTYSLRGNFFPKSAEPHRPEARLSCLINVSHWSALDQRPVCLHNFSQH